MAIGYAAQYSLEVLHFAGGKEGLSEENTYLLANYPDRFDAAPVIIGVDVLASAPFSETRTNSP
ncbi:MAG: hypothetical protein D9V46_01655 [Deltaproteobacteria bacterium]|uniref:hypothetical protein n=1 Tax=Hydrosulfovibrio ferrireducens TaxID=2934181 RepID=UPI0011FCF3C3|nr:MAG: hypothetical protein D9V46_01655 [Deltaproteobacteria bacterium]